MSAGWWKRTQSPARTAAESMTPEPRIYDLCRFAFPRKHMKYLIFAMMPVPYESKDIANVICNDSRLEEL